MQIFRKDINIKYLCKMILCHKKYSAERLSPLDARFIDLFDTVERKHQQRAMDNIYNSSTFFKAAYNSGKNC